MGSFWAAPCPVKAGDIPYKKAADRRKSRVAPPSSGPASRPPILPALIAATDSQRKATAEAA